MHLVLKSLTKDPRLNLKIKRSIVDILYAVADHYHKTGNQQGCEEFAAMFQASKMADHLSVLLYLGFASTDRYLKQKIAKLEALLTDEKFAGEALAQHMASEMADMAGRIEAQKQQEAARKQQQMMQQMMGGMGYSAETDMQRYWRDSRLWRIGPVTNEMIRNGIAESLGLPRSF